MPFYDNFVSSGKILREKWRDGLQALMDEEFANASTYYEDIEEEDDFGTLTFHPINARVTSLIDVKTGQRISDDYKRIIFPKVGYRPLLGTRYRFDHNIWLVFSVNNIRGDVPHVYIRRCNNTLNTQDKYGNIHQEPCYIDYKVTENQLFRNYSIDVPMGRIYIQCQRNKYTENINVNDRFIFGEDAYKIRERSRFDRRETFSSDSVRYISFYADYDELGSDDNVELNIANYKEYFYRIDSISFIKNIVGFQDTLPFTVYLDNEAVEEEVAWKSDNIDIAEIDEYGTYILKSAGQCIITGTMVNKPSINVKIRVTVEENPTSEVYVTRLTPLNDCVKLNHTECYSIYEYKNNALIDTQFDIKCFDVPDKYYRLFSDGNNFAITNLKTCEDALLRIVYTNKRSGEQKIFLVELGGIE